MGCLNIFILWHLLKKWYTVKKIEKEMLHMPEISLFYGIRVTMYYNDHMPPHFHAEYNGHEAVEQN